MSNGRNVAPNVKLGAAIMQKLSYLAEDMGVDIEEALRIVVGRWKVTKISKAKFRHLNDIASVLEQCDEAELDVQEVKSFLFWRDTLRKLGLSVDDVPKAIEYAETGKEANLTFQNIRGFWTTYEKLKAIGVAFTDLEQLKHDIENLHELAGEPEERIKELFSFLSQKDSLKEELARLQSETAQEREQLEHVKYELGEHKKYTTELAADNARTARQLSESKLHLANIDGNRQKLQKEIQKHEVTAAVLYSFEDFLLSRKAYIKDEFWYWLELIFKKKLKHDPLTEPHPPELQEQLRRQIVKYLKEMVEPDLLSKFDLDKIRTDARIAAAERLQRKHATVVKRMHQIRKDAKELEGGLQDFVDGIDHPRLDDDE